MLSRETLLAIIDRHLEGRSAASISAAAGLPSGAIAEMRKGRSPSMERAARLLDALGLELIVRRKGEIVDAAALNEAVDIAVAMYSQKDGPFDYDEDQMREFALETYRFYALQGDVVEGALPDSRTRGVQHSKRYFDAFGRFTFTIPNPPGSANEKVGRFFAELGQRLGSGEKTGKIDDSAPDPDAGSPKPTGTPC